MRQDRALNPEETPMFPGPILLAVLLCGCFPTTIAGGGHVGCDFRDGSVNGPEDRCQDRDGLDAGVFGTTCEQLGGEVIDGGCDTSDALGGCDISEGSSATTVINYYYPPMTEADAIAECDSDGGSWAR
jgi:hypothetical protein